MEQVYEEQLRDLIDKEFAREICDEELIDWIKEGGKPISYFIKWLLTREASPPPSA